MQNNSASEVFIIKTSDRTSGIKTLMSQISPSTFAGKKVALKANYNSADPFPASTHIDTLKAVVETLKHMGASKITLAERSGMGNTRQVLEKMGVFGLAEKLDFDVVVLDDLRKEEWLWVTHEGTHWMRGFHIAKLFADADRVVQTCCLKTHRFGGHFTLSLKNSVGLVAKKVPGSLYDYMWELHGSPHQRHMIAEVNVHYKPELVIMDGVKAFVDGGPERGKEVQPDLMLASSDRVALDAVGVAILRSYGSTNHIMKGRIFELDQLRRASELGLGAKSAAEIRLTPLNEECKECATQIAGILNR